MVACYDCNVVCDAVWCYCCFLGLFACLCLWFKRVCVFVRDIVYDGVWCVCFVCFCVFGNVCVLCVIVCVMLYALLLSVVVCIRVCDLIVFV